MSSDEKAGKLEETESVVVSVQWADGTPIEGAALVAVNGKRRIEALSDAKGKAALADLKQDRKWYVYALHREAKPDKAQTISVDATGTAEPDSLAIKLSRVDRPHNSTIGYSMIVFLSLMLVAVFVMYWKSHQPEQNQGANFSEAEGDLQYLIVNIEDLKSASYEAALKRLKTFSAATSDSRNENYRAAQIALRHSLVKLERQQNATAPIEETQKAAFMEKNLLLIDSAKDQVKQMRDTFFWTSTPWVYLELWVWGLIGVLVHKLASISSYMYHRCYHASGTAMHLVQLLIIPLLGVFASRILSMITIESDAGVILDFSKPEAMVIAAFLICLFPWQLYEAVRGRGASILSVLSVSKEQNSK